MVRPCTANRQTCSTICDFFAERHALCKVSSQPCPKPNVHQHAFQSLAIFCGATRPVQGFPPSLTSDSGYLEEWSALEARTAKPFRTCVNSSRSDQSCARFPVYFAQLLTFTDEPFQPLVIFSRSDPQVQGFRQTRQAPVTLKQEWYTLVKLTAKPFRPCVISSRSDLSCGSFPVSSAQLLKFTVEPFSHAGFFAT
jgi:hypothetical protein